MSVTIRGKKGRENHYDHDKENDKNSKFWRNLKEKAMGGDALFVMSPATCKRAATAAAFSRLVTIELKTKEGELHSWFSGNLTVAIADTSTAGTATLPNGTTVAMKNGRATVRINGSANAWLVAETNTLTLSQLSTTVNGKAVTVTQKTSVETIV